MKLPMTSVTREEIIHRQRQLCAGMAEKSMDAVCVGASAQIDARGMLRYLANYYVPVFEEYFVILRNGESALFVHDGAGASYAKDFAVTDNVVVLSPREYITNPAGSIADFLKNAGCKTVGTVWGRGVSSSFCISFRKRLQGIVERDASDLINRLRMVKSADETARLKDAVKMNESVLAFYIEKLYEGKTTPEAANEASLFALNKGAEDLYWMTSVAAIPSMKFHMSSKARPRPLKNGDYHYVVVEHSNKYGYFSEITQLISKGKPKDEYTRAFEAVKQAQREIGETIKPGVMISRLAYVAQNVLADFGYCDRNIAEPPCVGHSQGLDAWEAPQIDGDDNTEIRPGMRLNIHPAVSLPDGAKITSCVSYLSTGGKALLLSSLPNTIMTL